MSQPRFRFDSIPSIALVLILVASFTSTTTVVAQTHGADVSQAMDEPIASLRLNEQPVPRALTKLGRQVGIAIEIDEDALEAMPWGANTKLSTVNIENASLRDVLPQILQPLGLEYELGAESLLIHTTAPVKRLNRRASWDDLKLLQRCHNTPWSPEAMDTFTIRYRITSKVDAPALLAEQMMKSAGGTVAQVLEDATGSLGWVWLPNEDHIIVRTVQAQSANFMARRVTVKYTNEPLADILLDLANRADTPINFEPGMMLKLPPETAKHTSLALRNNSIRQGFELLSAHTGIRYSIQRGGINVSLSDAAVEASGQPRSLPISLRSPYVGKLTVPGPDGTYAFDILLREDDLPQDILDYRKQLIEEYIDKMRAEMIPSPTE